ncbi:MAG: hypothetical protein LC117_06920 [Bacteroidia bacterium]|nr:hypothetical protein [Bacteroidia bacterium]
MAYRLILSFSLLLLITSCAKDNDELDERDKFEGSWTCVETDNTGAKSTFRITIYKKGEGDSIQITNFAQLNSDNMTVLVYGSSLSIPNQNVDGFALSNASGNYTNQKISLSYKLDNDQFTAECKR